MSLGDNARALAKRMIAAYGANATLISSTKAYDAGTGRAAESTSTSTAVMITPPAPLAQGRGDRAGQGEGGGLRANMTCYLAAKDLAVVPIAKDMTLQFDSRGYQIADVQRIYSGPLVALYQLDLVA